MRRPVLTAILALLCAAPLAAAQEPTPTTTTPAAEPAPAPTIVDGVSAGGVPLGGLTVEEATARLRDSAKLRRALARDLILGAAGIPWKLTMADARLLLRPTRTAEKALAVTQDEVDESSSGGGAGYGVDVGLVLTHSRAAVRAFVRRVAAGSYRRPRNATLKLTLKHMVTRRARVGHRLDKAAARRQVNEALTGLDARRLHQRLLPVRPAVTLRALRARYPIVITVDRDNFRLRLFRHLRIWKRYGIAVGMAGLETPTGLYRIQNKQVNPAWHVPRRAWAGSLQGQTIPGGAPNNPLKARWLGIADGVGIHGTAEDWSIGSRASHGCIRMRVPDVIDLYRRVPVGAPVLIG